MMKNASSTLITVKSLSAFAVLLVLAACSLPSPSKNAKDSGATFAVASQEGAFTNAITDSTFAIPTAKTLSTKVCLIDIQYNKPILNHHFIVSGENSDDKDVVSDASGCVVWNENISYNHLAKTAYVEWKKTLTAKGYQQGSRSVSFAINPWAGSSSLSGPTNVISLKDNQVPELITGDDAVNTALQGLDPKTKQPLPHSLWLSNASITVLPKQLSSSGTGFNFEFLATPYIQTSSVFNQYDTIPFSQGHFTVKMSLIRVMNSGKSETRQIFSQSGVLDAASLFNQQLDVSNIFKLPGGCSMQQWDLAIEVSPIHPLPGLQDFHGIYSLGNCEAIQGKQYVALLDSQEFHNNGLSTFKVSDFATTSGVTGPSTSQVASASVNPDGTQDTTSMTSSVSVGPVTATLVGISQVSQTVKQKTYNLNFCLTNSVSQTPVRASSIKLTGLSGDLGQVRSTANGCFQVMDSVTYNYFSPECWAKKQIRVQSAELGLDAQIAVEINPTSESGFFFYDVRFPGNQRDYPCTQGNSKIIASSFAFDKKEYTYEISDTLALKFNKTGLLRLNVGLQRPSLATGANALPLNLPTGAYLLRWAIVDATLKDYSQAYGHIFGAGEKVIHIDSAANGVHEDITISSSNLKNIGNNSYFLFEISPMDVNSEAIPGFQNVTFRATPFLISNNSSSGGVEEIQGAYPLLQSLSQQFAQSQKETELINKRMSTKEYFAQDNGLTLINLSKDASPIDGVSIQQLKDLLKRGGFVGPSKQAPMMNDPLTLAFCNHWISKLMAQPLSDGNVSPIAKYIGQGVKNIKTIYGTDDINDNLSTMNYSCETDEQLHPGTFFSVQYHYLVDKPHLQKFNGGQILDFDVGQSISVSSSYSFSSSQSLGGGVGIKAGAALGTKDFQVASAGAGVDYNFSYSWSNSSSIGDSVGIGSGIGAKIESASFNIRAEDYEKCAVVTVNANQIFDKSAQLENRSWLARHIHKFLSENIFQSILDNTSNDEKVELSNRGYMICSGEKAHKNLVFQENYYIINQSVSTANNVQIADPGDARNRPFFFALRGDTDFFGALDFIQGNAAMPKAYESQFEKSYIAKDPYKAMFSRTTHSYPGHYIDPRSL
jgi:hypothetical protein